MREIAIIHDGEVCVTPTDDFGNTWVRIRKYSPRYWYYRWIIAYRWARALVLFLRGSIKIYGWRRGLRYLALVGDIMISGRDPNSVDWREFGIYTEREAQEAGICPQSILDIDIEDDRWKGAIG